MILFRYFRYYATLQRSEILTVHMALLSKRLGILTVFAPVLLPAPPGKSVTWSYTRLLSLLRGSGAAATPGASASPLRSPPARQSMAGTLRKRLPSCKVFAYVYLFFFFFVISVVGP